MAQTPRKPSFEEILGGKSFASSNAHSCHDLTTAVPSALAEERLRRAATCGSLHCFLQCRSPIHGDCIFQP